MGAALMLLVAAGIVAFWSPSSLPERVKWGGAVTAYLLVICYLALAGRGEPARGLAGRGEPARAPRPEARP
jgi:hypothetical protein